MTRGLFAYLVLLVAIPLVGQSTASLVALTGNSDVPDKDISKSLRKVCPNISITNDAAKSDYTLEAIAGISLTLFDRDGKTVRSSASLDLDTAVKDICHAVRTAVIVEVVDTQRLTQSQDARGDTSGGVVGAIVSSQTGRRTHTDSSTLNVIVKGEHALLDCYERRTGCATIGPGKYYGEQDGDGIWISYQMPITHKQLRNHYKIAGSW
ncbi:MAG TPA: hypothetical protein VMD76_12345 [Candidatus Sulfotelmatobacter sp.]|nr:hypothetical protein [Candidatus Sulfotelmatobacter sp.]